MLVITGMCVSATALVVALFLPNIRLPDTQSIEDENAEGIKGSTQLNKAGVPVVHPATAQMPVN